jgi:hypothetical protein
VTLAERFNALPKDLQEWIDSGLCTPLPHYSWDWDFSRVYYMYKEPDCARCCGVEIGDTTGHSAIEAAEIIAKHRAEKEEEK